MKSVEFKISNSVPTYYNKYHIVYVVVKKNYIVFEFWIFLILYTY